MGIVHRSQGVLRAGRRAQLRSEPAIVGRAGAGGARRARRACAGTALAADYDRIRDDIAASIPGFEDFNARVRDAGRLRPAQPGRASGAFPPPSGRAPLHRPPRARASASPPGQLAADDHPQPRPVQHHDLRPGRPLPRHPRRAAGGVHERGRHPRARLDAAGRWRRPRQPVPRRDAHRRPLRRGRLRHPARAAPPPTSPRPTCWCRSTRWPKRATPPPRSRWSSPWRRPPPVVGRS